MAKRASRETKPATVINYDMALVNAKMDRDGKDRLVINEIVDGKSYALLEVIRKVGPLAKDTNNNNLC